VLVILTVAAAALSAFSVWQATSYADRASDLRNQERVAAARRSEELAAFSVRLDHDLRLATPYCAAITERGWGMLDAFDNADEEATEQLANASRRAILIGSLFQEARTPDCQPGPAPALVPAAYEWFAASDTGIGAADPRSLAAAAREADRREAALMAAGVAFATALLFLTLADAAEGRHARIAALRRLARWSSAWLVCAALALAAGSFLLLSAASLTASDVLLVGLVVLAGGLVTVPAVVRHAERGAHLVGRIGPMPRVSWWRGRSIAWWAEILGAATLVLFAASALGLSAAAFLERDAESAADRIAVAAGRVLDYREQAAMRDLALVASAVELEIREQGVSDAVREEVAELERLARRDLGVLVRPKGAPHCPEDAWTPPIPADAPTLLAAAEPTSTAHGDHIVRMLEPAVGCAALGAAVRDTAARWGAGRSTFTVALVVLGLAGFLIGASGDGDRSPATARWLLRTGLVGAVLGIVVALFAAAPLVAGRAGSQQFAELDRLPTFAREYAAGRTALQLGECEAARRHLDAALEANGGVASVYLDRAQAEICQPRGATISAAAQDPAAMVRYLERAQKAGLDDARVMASLGWAQLLAAVDGGTPDPDELRVARTTTEGALAEIERSRSVDEVVPLAHVVRFNLAAIGRAVGDGSQASYARAVSCLTGGDACAGGAVADRTLQSVVILSALSDLELLPGTTESHDSGREALLQAYLETTPHRFPPRLISPRVDVYPQEVQLRADQSDAFAEDLSLVWYHRADERDPWAVVLVPSLRTMSPGRHLAMPIAADSTLPAGEYRVDVYHQGALLGRAVGSHGPLEVTSHRAIPDLGLSIVMPDDWERDAEFSEYGTAAAFGNPGDTPRLFLRRQEGSTPSGVEGVRASVDDWTREFFPAEGDLEGAIDLADPYFLGLSPVVVRDYPEIGWRAIGAFSSYGSTDQCPGTMLMALYIPDELGVLTVNSIVLAQELLHVPQLAGDYHSEAYGFSVRIPTGWDAFEVPRQRGVATSQFVARDCASGANVRIGSEPARMSLAQFVELNLDALRDFEDFRLLERTSLVLPGGVPAQRLRYTWSAPQAVLQDQVYAVSDGTGYFATVTTDLSAADDLATDVEAIIASFDVDRGS
jgi:hypothetical protein